MKTRLVLLPGSATMSRAFNGQKAQRGSSLIEVMVSVLLLSIGLIGSTQLITGAIKEQSALRYSSVALTVAQGLAERIRANRQAVNNGLYVDLNASGVALPQPTKYNQMKTFVSGQGAVTDVGCCTDSATLAAWDVSNAELSLQALLPNAAISLRIPTVTATSVPIPSARLIVIAWVEPTFNVANAASGTGGSEVILDDSSNGCPAGFNDTSPRQNVRCLQYRVLL